MSFAFDLWDYDAVRSHATAILARLRDGSMPCDGTWPAERIDMHQHGGERVGEQPIVQVARATGKSRIYQAGHDMTINDR